MERFAFVMPNARFHENVSPGPSFIQPPADNSTAPLFHTWDMFEIRQKPNLCQGIVALTVTGSCELTQRVMTLHQFDVDMQQ